VEYRDYSVPRSSGIGGAHNAVEFAKHQADYVEISRVSHPTVPGVAYVKYRVPALDKALKPTGTLKADVYEKTVYDPSIWPKPRLERALKEALLDSYHKGGNVLTREWTGMTHDGYPVRGFYNAKTGKIATFFFQIPKE